MKINVKKLSHYWKTVVATVGAVGIIGSDVVAAVVETGGEVTVGNVVTWVVAAATAAGVYGKANAEKDAAGEGS